jgi:DHA1 family tetracycline resistance protein-like MFS transporter
MPQAAAGRSPLLIIFVVVFLDLLGFGIVIPILPYYAEAYGASALTLGWLLAIYSAMQLVFAPLWGRLSDAHGRRPILVATILGQGASLLVLGFAPSLAWLFVGRALAGICGANLSTAAAYIADVTPEEGRARGMGVIGAGFGLGFIFGPAIGGLLSHWGYGTPMFVAAGVALAAGLFAWARLPEPPLDPQLRQGHRRSLDRAAIRESLGDTRTRIAILLFFVLTLAATQTETAFALFLESRRGYGAREAGLLLAFTGLVMAGVQGGLIGPLSRRFGEARLVAAGGLALGGALVVFATASHLALLVGSLAFLGFGMGLTHPSLQSLASLGAAPGRQGATMGVYQSAGSLARVAGPPFAGFLYDVYGNAVPFLAAAALSILAFGVVITWQTGGFVREATLTFRQGGFRGTLERYGFKLFAGFVFFYLVRDVTLYIVLPYLAARGVLSLWR